MEWKEYQIQDVCRLINGRAYSNDEMLEHGKYKIVRVGNLSGGNSTWFYSDLELPEDKYCHNGDLLFAWACTFGPHIWKEDNTIFHYHIWKIVEDKDVVDRRFFYYYLKFATGGFLGALNGSVMVHITKSSMEKMNIRIPKDLDDQRRIASILSSLDRKIELNNKINADLEEMAQAIFKNWFVDFEPFKDGKFVDSELGMIPEGWKVGTLGEFCKCLLGGTPSRSKEEYWNGEVNWINSGEINKFRILEASEKITELGLAKSATKLLPKKTTVLAITGATLGQVSLLEIDTCANQSVIGVLENTEVPYEYIYPFIKDRIEMLIQHQTGGAQQHINKDNVESLIFLLPAINVLEDYISLVSPMYKRIESQCFENLYLSTLRDTLLPRLMSGELEIPE